jgi:hypothetical protein
MTIRTTRDRSLSPFNDPWFLVDLVLLARQQAARNQTSPPVLDPYSCCVGLRVTMSSLRAVRYRKLALASNNRADADLLLKLAHECDRGILCSAEWLSAPPYADARFEWARPNDRR